MAKGNERNEDANGLGAGGPQKGDIGGSGNQHQQTGTEIAGGEGGQRRPDGSSRDSENLKEGGNG